MAESRRVKYETDNPTLVSKVEEGLPVAEVVDFGREAGFNSGQLAGMMQIPPRTYARRVAARSRLKVDEGERAIRLMRLYDRAKQVFKTNERTRSWLNRPLGVLGGRTPLDFARTEPGAREVEAVLDRFEEGVFS